jgi:hypothetical protein
MKQSGRGFSISLLVRLRRASKEIENHLPRFLSALLFMAILVAAPAPAQAGKKKEADVDYSDGKAGASPTPVRPKFDPPIPVSHDAEGVNLPYFEKGKLQMFFNIAKALRVDLYHIDMENAYMQTYDEKGVPDAAVFMTRSVLDLNTVVVTSDVPVTVRRSDFDIVGQKMVFNTRTRKGRMTGHVRMTIYNRQDMDQASPSPSPLAASSGSDAASGPAATTPQ